MAEFFGGPHETEYERARLERSVALRAEVAENQAKHPAGSSSHEELGETIKALDREIEQLGGLSKLGGRALYETAVA